MNEEEKQPESKNIEIVLSYESIKEALERASDNAIGCAIPFLHELGYGHVLVLHPSIEPEQYFRRKKDGHSSTATIPIN